VRELTRESAALFDRIIEITDGMPRSGELITVTGELLDERSAEVSVRLPEEVPVSAAHAEGSVHRILVNRYERDPRAREECIRHYGAVCFICGFDFVSKYGQVAAGFTHVHHLNLLSSLGPDYEVNPVRDLRPVCPNCHAVLHRREPPYSVEEVQRFLRTSGSKGV
jgi:predicted HNH restriction endonuclease